MALNAGEDIFYRLMPETGKRSAIVVSADNSGIVLIVLSDHEERPAGIVEGQYIVVTGTDHEYHTKIIGIEDNSIKLRTMWTEKRGYFRVDDTFPVVSRKTEKNLSVKKSKTFLGYSSDAPLYLPDETINPRLWNMLLDINTKLEMILERLYLDGEGLVNAKNRQVNISASGIKFIVDEKVEIGDILDVKMLLPTSPYVGMSIYGEVVRSNEIGDGKYEVALHFFDIDEEVREELILYTLNRQREIIRKQRAGR